MSKEANHANFITPQTSLLLVMHLAVASQRKNYIQNERPEGDTMLRKVILM